MKPRKVPEWLSAPEDSSPAKQKELGINVDETLRPRKSEGEKLRE